MGGSYDALMLRQQQSQQPTPGRYSGTAVPHVNGPSYSGYSQPQNWANPAVTGRDLLVHRDVLRQVAADLARMADQLQATLSACAPAAALAGGAAGSWPQAQQLNQVMSRAHAGVTQFTGQLQQAHTDMAARLATSADRYDAAEQQITSLIHAATDPSATIIQSGGQDTPVQPGYGQNWTPQQRASYYRIQRLENMPGNSGPNWTGTYPITEDTDFSQGSAAGYTWEQVKALVEATDPGAISSAGAAYGQIASTLTDISSQLSGHGQTLAANWGGSTAVTAVSQVQQLYQTASDLQANTWSAQQALAWYGPVLSTFRGSLPQPSSTHPADVQAANQAAQQRMSALNSHIETAFYQMPGAVNKNLPPPAGRLGRSGRVRRDSVRRRTRDRRRCPRDGFRRPCHRDRGSDRSRRPGDRPAGRPAAPGRRIRARVRDQAGRADADRAGRHRARWPGARRSRTRRPRGRRRIPGTRRACPRRPRDPPAGTPDRFRRRAGRTRVGDQPAG